MNINLSFTLTALVICFFIFTYSVTMTSGFELAVLKANQTKVDLEKFSNLEEPAISRLIGNSYFKTDSSAYDIDGFKIFAHLFDKNKVLRATTIYFYSYKFYSKFYTIYKNYMFALVQRLFVGDRFACFE